MTDGSSTANQLSHRSSSLGLISLLWRALPALLIVGTWLLFHPYKGVTHDSRLYVAQAIHWLQPEIFDRDLFFAFGSQDAFTIFSPIFAGLIDTLGLTPATMLITALGHALWLSGAAALALRLAPGRTPAIVGLIFIAAMTPFYGGWQTFSYGEGFATPRLLVEGLSLWALYGVMQKRLLLTALLLLPAVLLHPLVTAAGLCVIGAFLILRDIRWCYLAVAGLALVFVLAALGVAPFDRLSETMDPEWREIVAQRNIYLFPSLWTVADWSRLTLGATTILCAASLLSGDERRLMLAALVAGLAGIAATCLGSDILHNLFLIQVQPYRTLWLMQPLAYLSAGIVLTRLWQIENGPGLVILAGLGWLVCLTIMPVTGALLGIFVLGFAIARLRDLISPLPRRTTLVMFAASAVFGSVLVAARGAFLLHQLALPTEWHPAWSLLRGLTVIDYATILGTGGLLWLYRRDWARTALPVGALCLVILAAALWDRRDGWTRAIMSDTLRTPFDTLLAPDAQVFWHNDVRGAWLALGRPSYVSSAQGAGVAFTRQTAITFRDRARQMAPLGYELIDTWSKTVPPAAAFDRTTLTTICREADGLDALILPRAVEGSFAAAWDLPAPMFDKVTSPVGTVVSVVDRLYLYRCADLR